MEDNFYLFPRFHKSTVVFIFFDLHLPSLAPNIISCFSNHEGAFILLAPTSFTSVVCPSMGYDQCNFLLYIGYYLEAPSSLLYFQNFFITYFLWPFYLLLHSPLALPVNILRAHLRSSFLATWPVHRNLLDLITLNLLG